MCYFIILFADCIDIAQPPLVHPHTAEEPTHRRMCHKIELNTYFPSKVTKISVELFLVVR